MSVKFVIGLGSGRCGTASLAKLIRSQRGGYAPHEMRPILPWEPSTGWDPMLRLQAIQKTCFPRGSQVSGDVALFYVNYVPQLIEACPELRVVALKREKEATVKSYLRKLKSDVSWPINHFSSRPNGHLWYDSYPKYDLPLEESLRKFYDEYYERLAEHMRRFPENIRLWPMSALNAEKGVAEILSFIGVRRPRIKVGVRTNTTIRPSAERKARARQTQVKSFQR